MNDVTVDDVPLLQYLKVDNIDGLLALKQGEKITVPAHTLLYTGIHDEEPRQLLIDWAPPSKSYSQGCVIVSCHHKDSK